MHTEVVKVLGLGALGVGGSQLGATISPAEFQSIFGAFGAFGTIVVTGLTAANLIWIMVDRYNTKKQAKIDKLNAAKAIE